MNVSPRLSNEIFAIIIDSAHDDRETLLNISLVHSSFLVSARLHLFSDLKITTPHATAFFKTIAARHSTKSANRVSQHLRKLTFATNANDPLRHFGKFKVSREFTAKTSEGKPVVKGIYIGGRKRQTSVFLNAVQHLVIQSGREDEHIGGHLRAIIAYGLTHITVLELIAIHFDYGRRDLFIFLAQFFCLEYLTLQITFGWKSDRSMILSLQEPLALARTLRGIALLSPTASPNPRYEGLRYIVNARGIFGSVLNMSTQPNLTDIRFELLHSKHLANTLPFLKRNLSSIQRLHVHFATIRAAQAEDANAFVLLRNAISAMPKLNALHISLYDGEFCGNGGEYNDVLQSPDPLCLIFTNGLSVPNIAFTFRLDLSLHIPPKTPTVHSYNPTSTWAQIDKQSASMVGLAAVNVFYKCDIPTCEGTASAPYVRCVQNRFRLCFALDKLRIGPEPRLGGAFRLP